MAGRKVRWAAGAAGVAAGLFVATKLSPWPLAMAIRYGMNLGGESLVRGLARHVPDGVTGVMDEPYGNGKDERLDVFFSRSAPAAQPVIVWVHGGAWLSGDKGHVANYLRILAGHGFTTVGVNYSLAPGAIYPTPVLQTNAALAYLIANAARLHIDSSRIFLAGDSAGAQVAGQMINVITSPGYARQMGIVPAIARPQLCGALLYCGIYDPRRLSYSGGFAPLLKAAGWAYAGQREFLSHPAMMQLAVPEHMTSDAPPLFITVGNGDPLGPQSHLLAETASRLGIPVDALFFPGDYRPRLVHEYQFRLDDDAGRLALERTVAFLTRYAAAPLSQWEKKT